jgi:hypothetical protein
VATTRVRTPNGFITSELADMTTFGTSIYSWKAKPTENRSGGALTAIHLPGEETEDGFRVYGYALPGQTLDYL